MKDTLCKCNHWFEEHGSGGCECGCSSFEFERAFNTPEYIADRGGEHDPPCECALCVSERKDNGHASKRA